MRDFLGVYIHIPFCSSICSYCDFCKIYYDSRYLTQYLDSLEFEIKSRYKGEKVNSIYIGGGTPTCLGYQELERLLDMTNLFNKSDKLEFTIESNVESLDDRKIEILNKYNVNRISLGVQSFDDDCLRVLNRKHSKEMVTNVIRKLKTNGLTNINIDIIYGIIDDVNVVSEDINYFLRLDVPHISCYSLIIENNTILGVNNYKNIDDNIEYNQYRLINDLLSRNGYIQYEISNYSRKGYKSLHNLNYWDNGNYYGFGLSSVSFIGDYRISNTKNLTKYIKKEYIEDSIFEDKDIKMSNTMILGLRKVEGVSEDSFYNIYKEKIEDVFEIDSLLLEGKLIKENGYIRIGDKYLYLSNDILLNFLERK